MNSQLPAEYRAYMRRLERMGEGTFQRVIADTINTVAGFAHIQSIRNARDRMTYRNAYTERTIRMFKANPKKDEARINAITGSIQPYMATQDKGGYRKPKSGATAIMEVTLAARGGSKTRVVRRKFVSVGAKMHSQGKLFVGEPRGMRKTGPSAGGRAPYGQYQRVGTKLKPKLRMIRKMVSRNMPIASNKWHSDAMRKYSSRKVMTDEFLRQARYLLKK